MKITPVKSALIGGLCWLVAACVLHPSPFHLKWGVLLLLLAPLTLAPLGMDLAKPEIQGGLDGRLENLASSIQLPAAILLLPAFGLSEGLFAGALSLPWLMATALISLSGVARVYRRGLWPLEELSIDAGKVYLIVGALWATLSRLGMRPINFEPVIVLLTAIHFHYAGFLLPLMTGLAGRVLKAKLVRVAALSVIFGVPLTAIGITTSQLGFSRAPEMLAALITAFAGLMTAGLHFKLAAQRSQPRSVRISWFIAAISLSFGMLLAALYGSRSYFPMLWLDIPLMRALHGSANALGFGLIGVIGWRLHTSRETRRRRRAPGRQSNLETCALILALYQNQWEATNRDWSIRGRPDILATLYQIGFARSKPHGAPRSNAFGSRVRQVYEQPWLGELLDITPRPQDRAR